MRGKLGNRRYYVMMETKQEDGDKKKERERGVNTDLLEGRSDVSDATWGTTMRREKEEEGDVGIIFSCLFLSPSLKSYSCRWGWWWRWVQQTNGHYKLGSRNVISLFRNYNNRSSSSFRDLLSSASWCTSWYTSEMRKLHQEIEMMDKKKVGFRRYHCSDSSIMIMSHKTGWISSFSSDHHPSVLYHHQVCCGMNYSFNTKSKWRGDGTKVILNWSKILFSGSLYFISPILLGMRGYSMTGWYMM